MGRHSVEQKRIKRRNQKKRKRLSLKQSLHPGVNQDLDYVLQGKATTSELATDSGDAVSCTTNSTCGSSCQSDGEASDSALFAALDRVGDDSDQYWEETAGRKIQEFESFRDVHPSIVTDKQRSIEVRVDGTGQYRGTAALRRIDIKSYFEQQMQRDAKAAELCRTMRDRIETLENALKDSKVKMVKVYRENQRKIEKVRYFWRNKIFEGNSRGAELLKSALIYPDMFS